MGGNGGKEKAKEVRVQSTDKVNTDCSSFNRETLFPFTHLLNPAFSVTNLSSCSTLERKDILMVIPSSCSDWAPGPLPVDATPPEINPLRLHHGVWVPRPLSEYLLVISLEELQEAGLRARGALHSAEAQVVSDSLQIPKIHAKVLNPKTAAFPDGGQLSRPAGNPKRTQGSSRPRTDLRNSCLASSSRHCYAWEELKQEREKGAMDKLELKTSNNNS